MTDAFDPSADDHPAPDQGLHARICDLIRRDGPMSVAAFMTLALYDPRGGYYATKDPIGAGADFITAPEVSQMFGELIGLWLVQSWLDLGAPDPCYLIELGPGRGVMLADALRAARVRPQFLAAARPVLVEASPALQAEQARRLADAPSAVSWANALDAIAPGPSLIVANEFVDCLPIRQLVRACGAWRERMVTLHPDTPDTLMFALGDPVPDAQAARTPAATADAPDGALVELRPGVDQLMDAVAQRPGPTRLLVIDYGPPVSEVGDTLQAVRRHTRIDPLAAPGASDLTARVDFQALVQSAHSVGLETAGPYAQGEWLLKLGLEARAAVLARAGADARRTAAQAIHRLTDPSEMGTLFQVLAITSPGYRAPPGLGAPD